MLRAMVDTPQGRKLRIIRDPADAERAATELAVTDAIEWPYEPIYSGRIRYRREPLGRDEDWKDADRLVRDGYGDCEDLAAARVGELIASNTDPGARPHAYRTKPGSMHVVVRRGDGSLEDPSAQLGMGRMGRVGIDLRRVRKGVYSAEVSVPFAGSKIGGNAFGTSRADAARAALTDAIGFLAATGAWTQLGQCGYAPPFSDEVGVGDVEFQQWVAKTQLAVQEYRTRYGQTIEHVMEVVKGLDWNKWTSDPQGFANNVVDLVQQAVSVAPGPAGVILNAMLSLARWLNSEYPAVAVMDWQDAYVSCARALGYTGDPIAAVGAMQQDGWVCWDLPRSTNTVVSGPGVQRIPFRRPPEAPEKRSELEERLTILLAPYARDPTAANFDDPFKTSIMSVVWRAPIASWLVGLARARAVIDAEGVREFPITSKRGLVTTAAALKLSALPSEMREQIVLYFPPIGTGRIQSIVDLGGQPWPADEGTHRVLSWMVGGGFDPSGGGQKWTGLNAVHYLKILADIRPPIEPLKHMAIAKGVQTAVKPSIGLKSKKKSDWSKLVLPALGLGILALVAGDEQDEPQSVPVSPHRRQDGGFRATGGRGPRLAWSDARIGAVPDAPPALSPDTADRIVMLAAVTDAVCEGDHAELRRLCRGNASLSRYARELVRG